MSLTPQILDAFFERSTTQLGGTLPIRKTSAGIWVPTPVPVIVEALTRLDEMNGLGHDELAIVDAGSGDGRVAVLLAVVAHRRRVYGIEADGALCTQARANVEALVPRGLSREALSLVEGDYCHPATYEAVGVDPRQVGLFLNYPDGRQEDLARFIADYGHPDARLGLLTHDRAMEIASLALRDRRTVWVPPDQDWRLSLYQGAR